MLTATPDATGDCSKQGKSPGRTYVPATDSATHLFRAQEDGYLDLRLSRSPSPLFKACKKISDELLKHPAGSDPAVLEAVYHLKNQILWAFDFDYHRRHYQYLHQVIRQLFTQLDEGELVRDKPDRLALFQSLNRLRTRLNNQETEILQRQEQFEKIRSELEEKIQRILPVLSTEQLHGRTAVPPIECPRCSGMRGSLIISTTGARKAGTTGPTGTIKCGSTWASITESAQYVKPLNR